MQKSIFQTSTNYQLYKKRNAPTIIFLHGWLQTWESWSPIIANLSEKYQLVLIDLPGFGLSTFTSEQEPAWNSETYAQWLAAFIESLKLPKTQPLFIAGHSFGGKIAAVCASTYAQTTNPPISGIILINSSGLPDDLPPSTQFKQQLISLIPESLKQRLPQSLKSKVLSKLMVSTDHLQSSDVQRKILKQIVRENISSALNAITIPCLIVWGKLDTTTPMTQGQAFHIAIRTSTLVVCEKSGHFPFIDEPKKCTESIIQFIEEYQN